MFAFSGNHLVPVGINVLSDPYGKVLCLGASLLLCNKIQLTSKYCQAHHINLSRKRRVQISPTPSSVTITARVPETALFVAFPNVSLSDTV